MTDIIAMHRADLVDAVTAAVAPIKAERDALAAELAACKRQDELHWRTRKSHLVRIATLEAQLAAALRGACRSDAEAKAEPSGMEIAQREADEAAAEADPRDRVWGSKAETEVCPMCQGNGHTIESTYNYNGDLTGRQQVDCPDCSSNDRGAAK